MVKVCLKEFPLGSFPGQRTPGFEMNSILKAQIDTYLRNIKKDWDFTIIISGEGEVRVGKSVLAMQIAMYWVTEIWRLYHIKVPFNVKENYVFNGVDLIKKGNKLGIKHPYSPLIFDEAGADLEGVKAMSRTTKAVKDFFRECGQYNLLNILVIPEYFDLPKGIALSRSSCLINVYWKGTEQGMMQRGFFKYFSRPNKKWLYLKGKKNLDYNCQRCDFKGGFGNVYPLDEKEYRNLKRIALKTREKITGRETKLTHWLKGALAYMYDNGLTHREIAYEIGKRGKLKIHYRTVGKSLEGLREIDNEE